MNDAGAVLNVTVLFAIALALALLVERLLEILKAVYDLIDSWRGWHRYWTERAYRLRDRLENQMRIFEYVEPATARKVLNRFREMLLDGENGDSGTVPVLAADLVRSVYIRGAFKLVGIAIGIALVFWIEIDLVRIWQDSQAGSSWQSLALSGIAVGLGSGPLHKIISAIEKIQKRRARKEAAGV